MPEGIGSERPRTLRLDIAASVYRNIEAHAIEEDVGVADFVRRLVVKWSHEHPATTDS